MGTGAALSLWAIGCACCACRRRREWIKNNEQCNEITWRHTGNYFLQLVGCTVSVMREIFFSVALVELRLIHVESLNFKKVDADFKNITNISYIKVFCVRQHYHPNLVKLN